MSTLMEGELNTHKLSLVAAIYQASPVKLELRQLSPSLSFSFHKQIEGLRLVQTESNVLTKVEEREWIFIFS